MNDAWIWVHKKDPRIKGAVGFVTCAADIADALVKEGKAQDPRVGAHHLRPIDYGNKEGGIRVEPEQQQIDAFYQTKVMVAEEPKKRGRPRKAPDETQ